MKVLFIYSLDEIQSIQKPLWSWSGIQFGISYISSVLRNSGHDSRLVVLGSNHWKQSIKLLKKEIDEFQPWLVCLTSVFSQYLFIEKIAGFIKANWTDIFTLIGGVHATLNPEEVIRGPFDGLCVGEGEYPTLELCDRLEQQQTPESIPNLWIKAPDGNIQRNPTREFIADLDALPFPDHDMWKSWIREQADNEISILLGRGCPYDCTYCSNHALRKISPGKYVRLRSPENILQELSVIHQYFPYRKIYFEVETIAVNKKWLIELCDQLSAFNATIQNRFSYGVNFRISPQSIDENLFEAMQKANFYKINIGLESGSQRIRQEVLKRNYTNDDFRNVVSLAREHGLKVFVYNMIGLPGETPAEHEETVQLNRECQPDGHYTNIFLPYPGTELYQQCLSQGLIPNNLNILRERRQATLDLPNYPKKRIQLAYTWFNYRVYKGYKPLGWILTQVLSVKLKSNPITQALFRRITMIPGLRQIRAKFTNANLY